MGRDLQGHAFKPLNPKPQNLKPKTPKPLSPKTPNPKTPTPLNPKPEIPKNSSSGLRNSNPQKAQKYKLLQTLGPFSWGSEVLVYSVPLYIGAFFFLGGGVRIFLGLGYIVLICADMDMSVLVGL